MYPIGSFYKHLIFFIFLSYYLPPFPSRKIPFHPVHHRTYPDPPGSHRTHASPCQGRWLFVWAKSRRGSQTFPISYMAPCRGRSFLAPTRKEPKNRLRGGASNVVYLTKAVIDTHYPDPKAPSPGYPSRRCASVERSEVWFYRRGGYQPPVSWDYDPALAGGRLPPLLQDNPTGFAHHQGSPCQGSCQRS